MCLYKLHQTIIYELVQFLWQPGGTIATIFMIYEAAYLGIQNVWSLFS